MGVTSRVLGTALLVLALLAAACSGEGGSAADTPAPTVASTTATAVTVAPTTSHPTTTEAPDEPLVATTTEAPDEPLVATTTEAPDVSSATTTTSPPTTTEAPIVLTDSFRGVTAETITIGFASIDFEKFNETYGFNLTYANYDDTVQVYVDHINATGGINGRMVEVVHAHFLPVGPVTAEAVCVELAEDHQVFAVLNGFAGPGAESANLCFPGTYDTILIGGKPTPEQLDQSTAPWISYDISLGRRGRAFVNLLRETGRLEGLGPVMVYGANAEYEPILADTEAALIDAGVEVPITVYNEATGDEAATIAHLEVLLEKARTEGVSTIFTVGEAAYALQYLFRLGDEFTVLILNGDSANRWSGSPPDGIDQSGTLLTNKSFESRGDENMADCVALVEAGLAHEVRSPDLLTEGETNYWAALQNTCKSFELLRHIATAAGPDLTNDSFRKAAESLGPFSMSGIPYASLGPGKADARDTLSLAEWDHEGSFWVALSPPTNVR
jgi:hypothetical protein